MQRGTINRAKRGAMSENQFKKEIMVKNGRRVCPYYDPTKGVPGEPSACTIGDHDLIPDCGPNCEIPVWKGEHKEEICVRQDGEDWIAHRVHGFTNIQESLCGYGDNPMDAVFVLLEQEGYQEEKDEE